MSIENINDQMLTVREVSTLLHVHPNTLRRWADKGIIKSFCITPRGDRRFMSRDIDQFLSLMNSQYRGSVTQFPLSSNTLETQRLGSDVNSGHQSIHAATNPL
jgi:excisionase family DNA binding protein